METEECNDFSGCCLDRIETVVAEDCVYVAVLENTSAMSDGAWLRKCHLPVGTSADGAGANQYWMKS
jgi:hypothetical protein